MVLYNNHCCELHKQSVKISEISKPVQNMNTYVHGYKQQEVNEKEQLFPLLINLLMQ